LAVLHYGFAACLALAARNAIIGGMNTKLNL